jgi:hypothetical protein
MGVYSFIIQILRFYSNLRADAPNERLLAVAVCANGLREVGCLPGVRDQAPVLTSTAPQELRFYATPKF